MNTRFWSVLLVLLLALSPACARAADDPVVVRVGDVTYARSVVQAFYDATAQQYQAQGETIDAELAEELRGMVVEGYVDLGVTELKCIELGLTELTSEQKAVVADAAQQMYDAALAAYVEQIMASYNIDEAQAKESAPTLMQLNGYTYEAFYAQQLSVYHNKLMLDYVTQNTVFSAEEIKAHFDETFVAPDRALYQDNFPLFEQNVLVNGKDFYYVPAGIRMIDIVWLQTPAALADRLTALQAASAEDERAELGELLAEAGEIYKKEIAALGVVASTSGDYAGVLADYPALRLDDGYLVHAESTLWGNEMRSAALALKKPGDISAVMLLGSELCVLCYRASLAEGLPPYDEKSLQALHSYAEEDLRVRMLDKQLEKWKGEYDIETHPELLTASGETK